MVHVALHVIAFATGFYVVVSYNCTSRECSDSSESSLLQHTKHERLTLEEEEACVTKCGVEATAYPYFDTTLWDREEWFGCNQGGAQSPVNIRGRDTTTIMDPVFQTNWSSVTDMPNINTGHNLQVNIDVGTMSTGPNLSNPDEVTTFDTYGWHIHAPSEHRIGGSRFDMEMHITSKLNTDGMANVTNMGNGGTPPVLYAVVAVLFRRGGTTNECVAKMLENTSDVGCQTCIPELDLNLCFQEQLAGPYWFYSGSLTTPPCSEFVNWIVLEKTASITRDDLRKFQLRYAPPANARPTQELNGRSIQYYSPPTPDSRRRRKR